MKKIAFYHPGRGGSCTGVGYYRIVKVAEQLRRAGADVTVFDDDSFEELGHTYAQRYGNLFLNFDVFWLSYFADKDAAAALFFFADRHGKEVVVDVDDNYLDTLPSHPVYGEVGRFTTKRAVIGTVLHFATHITVSTEPLRERLQQHFREIDGTERTIHVIPNFSDLGDWPAESVTREGIVTIGYVGSNSHQEDLKLAMPAVGRVMERHPNVLFKVVGGLDKRFIGDYFSEFHPDALARCDAGASVPDFREWPAEFSSIGIDVGIAPLASNPFTRCKSHIKWMEYAAMGIPAVVSAEYPYVTPVWGRNVCEDGKTALVAGDWEECLERLVSDAGLRKSIGGAARRAVAERWQYGSSGIAEAVSSFLDLGCTMGAGDTHGDTDRGTEAS